MDKFESLSHTKWECKYHVVFIPERCFLGSFAKLAAQKESHIEEGHLLLDHEHMMLSIPPKIRCFAGG